MRSSQDEKAEMPKDPIREQVTDAQHGGGHCHCCQQAGSQLKRGEAVQAQEHDTSTRTHASSEAIECVHYLARTGAPHARVCQSCATRVLRMDPLLLQRREAITILLVDGASVSHFMHVHCIKYRSMQYACCCCWSLSPARHSLSLPPPPSRPSRVILSPVHHLHHLQQCPKTQR